MYRKDNKSGLVLGQRERPSRVCRKLTRSREQIVLKTITDKAPEQLELPLALWIRPVIRLFIHERFDIKLPVRTLGHYSKRWGFTLYRSKKMGYKHQPVVFREGIEGKNPAIMKRTKSGKVGILWGDERDVSNQDPSG